MRISADKNDPGYANYRGPCRVFLDCVEQRYVFACDVEAGYIERALLDESGNIYLVGGDVAQETVYGAVRVEAID